MSESYTAANPVVWNAECKACGVTISTDNPVDKLQSLFAERHRDCGGGGKSVKTP